MKKKITYSVVAPIYNEIEIIDEFCKRVTEVMKSIGKMWELVLVDDGSSDGSTERILELASVNEHLRPVIFARNFGHQIAVTAGLDYTRGEAVTIIDADLQDPPEVILDLIEKYGREAVLHAMEDLLDYGERMALAEIRKLPQGTYETEDVVEDDGFGNGPFTVKVRVTIDGDRVIADFTGTSPQAQGPINCSFTGLATGARCLFKAITNPEIPANGGTFRPLEVICPEGTILSAVDPAPVSLYYESLIAAIDTMWKALAPVLPDRLPAGHQRSVGATFISGIHPDSDALFVMGEPLVGGWGASPGLDGDSGQFCCGNGETFNIPVELAESRYGFEIDQYAFHTQDGGAGEFTGGRGVVLDYRITADEAFMTYAATRTEVRPWSLAGGFEGSTNYAELIRRDGSRERFTMCTRARALKGETFRLVTATGGGYGDPMNRPKEKVMEDIRDGYFTTDQADRWYGVES